MTLDWTPLTPQTSSDYLLIIIILPKIKFTDHVVLKSELGAGC